MNRSHSVLLLLAATLSAGCYRYTPVDPGDVRAGDRVRVFVASEFAESHGQALGRVDRELDGTVLDGAGAAGDPLLLRVPVAADLQQRIAIPRSQLLDIRLRDMDALRTYGLIGAGAVVAVAGFVALEGETSREGDGGKGGVDRLVIPLGAVLRFVF